MKGNKSSFNYPTDNKGKGKENIDSNERTTSRPSENGTGGPRKDTGKYSKEIADTLNGKKK